MTPGPVLILLNGAPAAGKSTIARALVATQPLALDLDIDVVRNLLGDWRSDPIAAGLTARELALAMIERHVAAGHPVVVPQFLGRADFIDTLAATAERAGVPFVEMALIVDRSTAITSFETRTAASDDPIHADAAAMADATVVGQMVDQLDALLATRPQTHRVEVLRHDIDATLAGVLDALRRADIEW